MKIVVIYGAPLSGKTTYVQQRMNDEDIVYDYDAIMHAITNNTYQQYKQHVHKIVMDMRDDMITYAKQHDTGTLYVITTFLSYKLQDDLSTHTNVQYIKMNTSLDECKERLRHSTRTDKEDVMQVIHEWYGKYVYNIGLVDSDELTKKTKRLYKGKDWNKLKLMARERDNNLCQMCKRKGKYKYADLVHHLIYVKANFSKALDIDNLMCVCSACHNKIHARDEREVFTGGTIERNIRTIKI